ncbi:MAG: phage holin family protein [Deltaproteobacteria bacterium]
MAPRAVPIEPIPIETVTELSTPELLRQALDETKELVRLEIKLAQAELHEDVRKLKVAGILLAIAGALFIVALAMFDVAVVFALGGTASAAVIVAFIVLAEVAVVGFIGYRQLPKVPLERTRSRLATDVRALKEQVT